MDFVQKLSDIRFVLWRVKFISLILRPSKLFSFIWCDFDRASSL